MTVKTDYILIGIMAVVLLFVAYSNSVTNNRIDKHETELKAYGDSIVSLREQRMSDYMERVRLQLSVDSIRDKRNVTQKKYNDKRDSIALLHADSTDLFIRAAIHH